MPIEPLQQVFMLFYAIFWGAIANVQPRWKPFQWHLFFAVPQARRRAIAALVLLNVHSRYVFLHTGCGRYTGADRQLPHQWRAVFIIWFVASCPRLPYSAYIASGLRLWSSIPIVSTLRLPK